MKLLRIRTKRRRHMRPRKVVLTIELSENMVPITKLRNKKDMRVLVKRMGGFFDDLKIEQIQANVVKSKK